MDDELDEGRRAGAPDHMLDALQYALAPPAPRSALLIESTWDGTGRYMPFSIRLAFAPEPYEWVTPSPHSPNRFVARRDPYEWFEPQNWKMR